ncbi:biopolymer transporter ExbD [Aeromonas caviae]|uniref:ExbD/TolR family protein n=1 Tax=Aeromonas TaxID=642 RepID=UPI00191E6ADC|nr:biopolymer transporter ExbD [Aeromonas caviae]MBL0558711.1 biopolymer transporter ExbD [Aeromonas caviae]MBL0581481.1 biopolymer transporter ExbD [Aeromonas caviae]MCK2069121.1 biopolymer transporter ExbD [Aeromonas caviae]MCU7793749.1 biopolymer transporter ExbD [Aeromonas caviae]MDX7754207.1 biopolymer transporter ExbD [Aeromonas caviae]
MRRQSKRQRDEVQIDMTPMLDIVFIMLIFFIVTTSFVREAGLEVHRPQAKAQKSSSIMLAIGAQGQIFLDRKQVDVERVQATLARLLAEQPEASLVIQADERVPHGKVVRVMDEAKAAGIANIAVAVAPK